MTCFGQVFAHRPQYKQKQPPAGRVFLWGCFFISSFIWTIPSAAEFHRYPALLRFADFTAGQGFHLAQKMLN